jgi:hypothetical protein
MPIPQLLFGTSSGKNTLDRVADRYSSRTHQTKRLQALIVAKIQRSAPDWVRQLPILLLL